MVSLFSLFVSSLSSSLLSPLPFLSLPPNGTSYLSLHPAPQVRGDSLVDHPRLRQIQRPHEFRELCRALPPEPEPRILELLFADRRTRHPPVVVRGVHERVVRQREEPVSDRSEEPLGGAALEVGAAAAADEQGVAGEDEPRSAAAEAAAESGGRLARPLAGGGGGGEGLVRREVEGAAPFRVSGGRQRSQGKPTKDQRVPIGLEADVRGGARGLRDGGARDRRSAAPFAASFSLVLVSVLLFRKDLLELARARDVVGVDVAVRRMLLLISCCEKIDSSFFSFFSKARKKEKKPAEKRKTHVLIANTSSRPSSSTSLASRSAFSLTGSISTAYLASASASR